ncbi:MAG: sigma-70 family RNA polymerase sigma factor [Oscillospiraceae bacterium]|jgi:RNA polymerase sporulation-specific sigma factor|nr:sigma-70 family RNA polymerase sigma factor [Oscillospiraceae bacterium]
MMEQASYDALLRARGGDEEATSLALEENSGLIWSVARRFMGRGVDPDDLYQLGCVGFLKAVRGFDPEYGTQFSTYAVPKITGEIRRFLRDDGSIKVSRSIKETAVRIRAARRALQQRLGCDPSVSELSAELGISAEDIAAAETAVTAPESLHRQTGEEGFTLENMLTDSFGEEALVERVALRTAIDALPERERQVICLRYFRGMTQERASRILRVSQVQISRIERRAINRLRAMLTEG